MHSHPRTALVVFLSLFGIAACGGGGGGGGGSTAAPPPNNVPRFAYVANEADATVSIYTVNAETGQLRHNGFVTAGGTPRSVSVDPSGKFAYVANGGSGDVSSYTINATTGALVPILVNTPAGNAPSSVTVDPTGKFAYVANFISDDVSAYTIDAATGVLAQIPCVAGVGVVCNVNNFMAGDGPQSVSVDPTGKFAYVANADSDDVSAYTIHATTGALTQIVCGAGCNGIKFLAGDGPQSVTVTPSGKFAYVANAGSDNVSAYTINANTGVLTSIGAAVPAGDGPRSVAVDPSGKFAYVANFNIGLNGNSVSAYTIHATTGALTSIGPAVATGTNPRSVSVDPSGKFAYATNESNDVSAYAIDATTGALTALPTLRTRGTNVAMAMTKGTAAAAYTPKFAYVTNNAAASFDVSAYTIDATTGALTPIDADPAPGIQNFPAGFQPRSVAVDPSGRLAYVTNLGGAGGSNISAYTVSAATGALTQILCQPVDGCSSPSEPNNFSAGAGATSVAVDPTGRFAFVANSLAGLGGESVATHLIAAGGKPTLASFINSVVGASPRSVAVDPTGRFVYAANFSATNVSAYTINATTGALTQVPCVVAPCSGVNFPAGTNPSSVTVDPTGKFAYVANLGSDNVSAYTINATTGALTSVGAAVLAGTSPASVTVDPSGKFAYVANSFNGAGGNSVSAYTIHPTTGALTQINCVVGCNGTSFLTGLSPRSVTVDPSGKFAYVANSSNGVGGNSVSAYTINATTGALTSIGPAVATGNQPFSVTTTGTIQ